mmetsp:Transcript_16207/g.52801  ORF Transcript_16207/g.52801 Transcript_16207/m.52801 type:complete len:269 (-) Transcript_16207:820-1626(-)
MPPTRGTRPRSAGQSTVQSRDQSGTSSSMSQHQPLWPAPARHPTPVWNSRATANRAAPPHLRRTAAPVASSRAHPALLRRLVPSGAGLACRAGRTSWQLTQRPPLPTRRVTGQSRTPPRAPAPMPSSAHWPTGPPCAPAASRPKPRPPPARHRTAGEASNRRPRARRAAAAAVAAAAASRPRRRPARACAPRTPRRSSRCYGAAGMLPTASTTGQWRPKQSASREESKRTLRAIRRPWPGRLARQRASRQRRPRRPLCVRRTSRAPAA